MCAARMKSGYFEIKKYVHRHTCDTTLRKPNHRQASVKTLSNMICGNYSEKKDGLKPKQIINQIKEHYGVHINYKKAWRAKGAAENLVRGTHEESYINLAKWLCVAKERNPGTVTYLQSSEGKFKYSFLAFGASIRGFRLMRRVIAVDGTFLKGKFKGTLLCATSQDGDYHLYPLAFAIVDSENNESWNWFMRCLESIIPDASDLVFISDRAPSIAKALTDVYPSSHHSICRFHLENNIKARFHSADMIDLVQAASNAYTVVEFAEVFQTIAELNQKLAAYLYEADFSKWARCYAPLNRYNIMTTNIVESLNAMLRDSRDLPVKALYEAIRMTLTDWFLKRRLKAADHSKTVTPTVVKNLVKNYDDALRMDVYRVNEDEFQVKKNNDTFIVNLPKKQCSCRAFDIDRIPCIHGIAAAKSVNLDVNAYVDEFYSTKTWAEAYAESIHPNPDEKSWVVPEYVTSLILGPPSTRVNRGRPAKKRKRSVGEYGAIGSNSKGYKCSRCSQVGHNKQTCDVAI